MEEIEDCLHYGLLHNRKNRISMKHQKEGLKYSSYGPGVIKTYKMMSTEQTGDLIQYIPQCNNEIQASSFASKDAFEWLVIQNKELKEKINQIELEREQWKSTADDCKEKLKRLNENKGKENYVDSFYDDSVTKLIQSIGEENVKLKKQNEFSGANKIYELYNAINTLRQQLDTKGEENKLLKEEIKKLSCADCSVDCKDRFLEFERVYSTTKLENTNLRNQIRNQIDIMCYMKSQFSKQRNEFITIFTRHYLKNGEQFIEQLKSLDSELPESLQNPLYCDVSASIENLYMNNKEISPGPIKEFKESPESINQRLRKAIKEKEELILSLERRRSALEENVQTKGKQLEDANNEWRVVYGQVFSKLEKQQKQYEQLETYSKHLEERNDELNKNQIPTSLRQRSASVSSGLMRSAGQSTKNSTSPLYSRGLSAPNSISTLTQESPASGTIGPIHFNSFLLPAPSEENEDVHSRKTISSNVQDPLTMKFCRNCRRDISSDKYALHITYCGKSGSHMC